MFQVMWKSLKLLARSFANYWTWHRNLFRNFWFPFQSQFRLPRTCALQWRPKKNVEKFNVDKIYVENLNVEKLNVEKLEVEKCNVKKLNVEILKIWISKIWKWKIWISKNRKCRKSRTGLISPIISCSKALPKKCVNVVHIAPWFRIA